MASKDTINNLRAGDMIRVNGQLLEFCGITHSGLGLGITLDNPWDHREVEIDRDTDTVELVMKYRYNPLT